MRNVKAGRVVVMGSVKVDFVVRSQKIPSPGETGTGGLFQQHQGGKAGNQAGPAAPLGQRTLFIGAVGDDEFGRPTRMCLQIGRVEVSNLIVMSGLRSGVALVMIDEQAENLISVAQGANAALNPAVIRGSMAKASADADDIVLVSNEIPGDGAVRLSRQRKRRGAETILNPSPAEGVLASPFALVCFLTPNGLELQPIAEAELAPAGSPSVAETDLQGAATRALLQDSGGARGVREAAIVRRGTDGSLVVPTLPRVPVRSQLPLRVPEQWTPQEPAMRSTKRSPPRSQQITLSLRRVSAPSSLTPRSICCLRTTTIEKGDGDAG